MEDHVPRHAQMGAWVLINDRWYYQTAWAWLHKLRRAMVRPGRDLLGGAVEVDETYVGGRETGVVGPKTDEDQVDRRDCGGQRPRAGHWPDPKSRVGEDGGCRTDASIGRLSANHSRLAALQRPRTGPGRWEVTDPRSSTPISRAQVVEAGPVPAVDGVVRWRRKDLARLLETFAISLDATVGRELKALGFAKISARPRHYAQNELAVEAFKKNFPAELAKIRARLPKGVEIELWWQDEARIGQKNKLTRRWARRGTRPRAPRDQRTEWAYIFGAICPAKGKGAGLVMPWCDTDAMAAHLIEISAAVDPGAHAVLIVDQAGWHLTPKLAIPDNITVLALPPRSPELNPVENVWQFMRDNWLSNRIFKSYEDHRRAGCAKRSGYPTSSTNRGRSCPPGMRIMVPLDPQSVRIAWWACPVLGDRRRGIARPSIGDKG